MKVTDFALLVLGVAVGLTMMPTLPPGLLLLLLLLQLLLYLFIGSSREAFLYCGRWRLLPLLLL